MSERIAGDAIWAYWLLAATVEEDVREQAQVLVVDAMHEIRPKTGKLKAIRTGVAAAAKKAKRPGPEGEAAWTDFVEGLVKISQNFLKHGHRKLRTPQQQNMRRNRRK